MIRYKEFYFPEDLPRFIVIPFQAVRFFALIKRHNIYEIAGIIHNKRPIKKCLDSKRMEQLQKTRKIVDYLLVRLLHLKKPCLLRSLILLDKAIEQGVPAFLCVGIHPDGDDLVGHSWIEIDGVPFMENTNSISEYTLMIKE